jgi:hypothetical protein
LKIFTLHPSGFFDGKRALPRQARLDTPGTLHHVMIRGIEGETIFRDNQHRKDFVARLGNLAKQTGARILAGTLLSNRVHLLFFSGATGEAGKGLHLGRGQKQTGIRQGNRKVGQSLSKHETKPRPDSWS